jgi:hypothetical protein
MAPESDTRLEAHELPGCWRRHPVSQSMPRSSISESYSPRAKVTYRQGETHPAMTRSGRWGQVATALDRVGRKRRPATVIESVSEARVIVARVLWQAREADSMQTFSSSCSRVLVFDDDSGVRCLVELKSPFELTLRHRIGAPVRRRRYVCSGGRSCRLRVSARYFRMYSRM